MLAYMYSTRSHKNKIDAKVDTPYAKLSFHILEGALSQRGGLLRKNVEYAIKQMKLDGTRQVLQTWSIY